MLSKQDAGIIIDEKRQEKGLSWSELAERAQRPNVAGFCGAGHAPSARRRC